MGFFSRLLGNKDTALLLKRAQEIVNAYGAVMMTGELYRDSSTLPYSKDIIKQALLICMAATTDASARESLKVGYVMLADFQDGVGPGPHTFDTAVGQRVAAEGEALMAELKAAKF